MWRVAHYLFEKGWPKAGDLQSIYNSNAVDAIRFISRENATL